MAILKIDKNEYTVKIGREGRIVIPSEIRKKLGLKEGDIVKIKIKKDKIFLQFVSFNYLEEKIWKKFEKVKESLSEELLRERRKEAKKEYRNG